jgi:O-antigen/teichoic acid export membrane protein
MIRDVLAVAKGTMLGQAIFALLSPVVTRLYSTHELGIYGLVMAFAGVAVPVAGLRFELAAIAVKDEARARDLLLLSLLAIVPVAAVAAAGLITLKSASLWSYAAVSWGLVAMAIAIVIVSGVLATLRSSLIRRQRFGGVARSLAWQGVIRGAFPVGVATLTRGALGLTSGELVSRLIGVLILLRHGGGILERLPSTLVVRRLRETAAIFWKYPALMVPSSLLDAIAVAIPVPIVATCYDLETAGKFALVQRLAILPAAFIVSSVGDVFHSHAAQVMQEGGRSARQFLFAIARPLLLFALAVYLPLAVLAPFAAPWIFGREWTQIGIMIAALAPMCVVQTVVSPLSRGLLLGKKEERKLLADIVCLIIPAGTLYLASGKPIATAIAFFSLASVCAYAVYFLIIVVTFTTTHGVQPDEQSSEMP